MLIIWSVAWLSFIRVEPGGLVVRNMFYVHTIPWDQVSGIVLGDGLEILLADGEVVESVQFGGSLLGAFTGYPSYRKPLRRLQAAHRAAREHPGRGEAVTRSTRFAFPYLHALAYLAYFGIPAFTKALFFQ